MLCQSVIYGDNRSDPSRCIEDSSIPPIVLTVPTKRFRKDPRAYIAALALLGATANSVGAQSSVDTRHPVDTSHVAQVAHDSVRLFVRHDVVAGAGAIAVVLALMPLDRSIARAVQRPGIQSNSALKGGANIFNAVGFPGAVVFSAGTYFLGLGTHSQRVAELGMHTGEAIILGGVMTEVLKGTIGRARPYVDVNNPHDYHFGKGFSNDDFTSLPSGHVTIAFAAATMVSREVGRSWPDAARYVTPISYGTAALVAGSRIYKNQHWASDVVGAAGVGTLAGVLFDRYNRGHPNNIFDRVFLPTSIVPARGGVSVAWSL